MYGHRLALRVFKFRASKIVPLITVQLEGIRIALSKYSCYCFPQVLLRKGFITFFNALYLIHLPNNIIGITFCFR